MSLHPTTACYADPAETTVRLASPRSARGLTDASDLLSLVTILTVFMVVGLNETAAVLAAALPIIPVLAISICGGIKAIGHKLIDLSKSVHAGRIIRSVLSPQGALVIVASSRFQLRMSQQTIFLQARRNCSSRNWPGPGQNQSSLA